MDVHDLAKVGLRLIALLIKEARVEGTERLLPPNMVILRHTLLLLGRLALEGRDAIAWARMEVAVRVAPDEGGNQRSSEAIRGNQGMKWLYESHLMREAIRGDRVWRY
jgi:hypothetical protein